MFKRLKRMIKDIETPKDVLKWQKRLAVCKAQYEKERKNMKTYEDYYEGTRKVQADANRGIDPTKLATNVRNIVYELIESQVDSSIPMPKVRAIHSEDDELAKKIEKFLENKVTVVEEICDRIVLINNAKKILEGKVSEIKRRFCDNIFEIVTPIVNDLQLPYDCKICESKCNDSLQTIKVMIPKGRNADLINQILQQTDLISYKELLPSMNEVFIKTVTKNE